MPDETTLFFYEARSLTARDVPDLRLPCCYDHTGTGCPHDATHWVLGGHGWWQVVDALPAGSPPTPPMFCAQHAAIVCERRNAKATPGTAKPLADHHPVAAQATSAPPPPGGRKTTRRRA